RRLAPAAAGRRRVAGDEEHRGLAVLLDAEEDDDRLVRGRQGAEAGDVVVGLLLRLAGLAQAQVDAQDLRVLGLVRLRGRRGLCRRAVAGRGAAGRAAARRAA